MNWAGNVILMNSGWEVVRLNNVFNEKNINDIAYSDSPPPVTKTYCTFSHEA